MAPVKILTTVLRSPWLGYLLHLICAKTALHLLQQTRFAQIKKIRVTPRGDESFVPLIATAMVALSIPLAQGIPHYWAEWSWLAAVSREGCSERLWFGIWHREWEDRLLQERRLCSCYRDGRDYTCIWSWRYWYTTHHAHLRLWTNGQEKGASNMARPNDCCPKWLSSLCQVEKHDWDRSASHYQSCRERKHYGCKLCRRYDSSLGIFASWLRYAAIHLTTRSSTRESRLCLIFMEDIQVRLFEKGVLFNVINGSSLMYRQHCRVWLRRQPGVLLYKGLHYQRTSVGEGDLSYDNDQPAATLWYHDHGLGKCKGCHTYITRMQFTDHSIYSSSN